MKSGLRKGLVFGLLGVIAESLLPIVINSRPPEIDSVLAGARPDSSVGAPALLYPEDVECIVRLSGGQTAWSLLGEYSGTGGASRPFHNFLNDKKIGACALSEARQREVFRRVEARFGYEMNQIADEV